MAKPRHLKNAPITEALIDIRVKLPAGVDVPRLRSLQQRIADKYPQEQERRAWQAQFDLRPGEPRITQGQEEIEGYNYIATDKTTVVQFRLDGFAFSRLKPYES